LPKTAKPKRLSFVVVVLLILLLGRCHDIGNRV
jgi:hypothetical protein